MQIPTELKRKYLERKIRDLNHLISSLELDDYDPALKLGHQVKGNAETFEFPHIAPLAIAIEFAARERNKDRVEELVLKMKNEIHAARTLFQ